MTRRRLKLQEKNSNNYQLDNKRPGLIFKNISPGLLQMSKI